MAKTLRAKCLDAAQKLARISEADDNGYAQCWSCGVIKHYKEMDGGHYIPKGSSSYWALEPENIHPQCKGCNSYGMRHGVAAQQYTISMQDYYGKGFVEEMIEVKSKAKKMCKADYESFLREANEEIKYHEARVCGALSS